MIRATSSYLKQVHILKPNFAGFHLVSMWCPRFQAQRRLTLFFASTQLAGAFVGLLASAIGKMEGLREYLAWRWMFLVEGLRTCVTAYGQHTYSRSCFPSCTNSSVEEPYRQTENDRVRYFSPTIIETYGYIHISTQLHSVLPSALALAFFLLIAYLSDCTRHRFLLLLTPTCIAIIGVATLLRIHNNRHGEYAALLLVATGRFSARVVMTCYFFIHPFYVWRVRAKI